MESIHGTAGWYVSRLVSCSCVCYEVRSYYFRTVPATPNINFVDALDIFFYQVVSCSDGTSKAPNINFVDALGIFFYQVVSFSDGTSNIENRNSLVDVFDIFVCVPLSAVTSNTEQKLY